MEGNINILDELKSLDAGTLADISKNNVYFLPEGYFAELPNNIKGQIWLNSVPKVNPYHLPLNYFEHLPGLILDKLSVQNKLAINKQIYKVPDGYFNSLAENILENIKAKNNSVQQELELLSPLLSKIPKTNVYTVPAAYFETLTPVSAQPAKVISIGKKARKWVTYAAAACIAALMFGGGYYYLNENKVQHNNSSAVIAKYADINVQQAILQLSDSAINSYLQNDNTDISVPQNDDPDININTLIQNMSDEEINNYLRENSDPEENTKGI